MTVEEANVLVGTIPDIIYSQNYWFGSVRSYNCLWLVYNRKIGHDLYDNNGYFGFRPVIDTSISEIE